MDFEKFRSLKKFLLKDAGLGLDEIEKALGRSTSGKTGSCIAFYTEPHESTTLGSGGCSSHLFKPIKDKTGVAYEFVKYQIAGHTPMFFSEDQVAALNIIISSKLFASWWDNFDIVSRKIKVDLGESPGIYYRMRFLCPPKPLFGLFNNTFFPMRFIENEKFVTSLLALVEAKVSLSCAVMACIIKHQYTGWVGGYLLCLSKNSLAIKVDLPGMLGAVGKLDTCYNIEDTARPYVEKAGGNVNTLKTWVTKLNKAKLEEWFIGLMPHDFKMEEDTVVQTKIQDSVGGTTHVYNRNRC